MFSAAAGVWVRVDAWCVPCLLRQRSCLRLKPLDLLSSWRESEVLLPGERAGHILTEERARC